VLIVEQRVRVWKPGQPLRAASATGLDEAVSVEAFGWCQSHRPANGSTPRAPAASAQRGIE
jgi:hypothetical protein